MTIRVTCSSCQKAYRVKDELAGKAIRCQQCQQVIRIPAPTEEEEPEVDFELPAPRKKSGGSAGRPGLQKKSGKAKSKSRRGKKSGGNSRPIAAIGVGVLALGLVAGGAWWAMMPKPEADQPVADNRNPQAPGEPAPAPPVQQPETPAPAPEQTPADVPLPATRPVVVLNFDSGPGGIRHRRALRRELYRQSFSMTAREKFHFAARDELLREPSPSGEGAATIVQVQTRPGNTGSMSIMVYLGPTARSPGASADFPPQEGSDLLNSLTNSLQLSEGTYSDLLAKLSPPYPLPSVTPPATVPGDIPDPELFSLISDLRQLHRAARAEPDSPRFPSLMAVRYALLGSVTQYHWGADSKIYFARGLLTAELAAKRWPQDAQVAWSRAFVRGILSLDQPAVEEIARARGLQAGQSPPPWSEALDAFVNWEEAKLAVAVGERKPLAAYFKLLAAELAGSPEVQMQAAEELVRLSPRCVRGIQLLADSKNLGHRRTYGAAQFKVLLSDLPELVSRIDNLPASVQSAIQSVRQANSEQSQFDAVAGLGAALRAVPLDQDDGEPSLAAAGTLLENMSLVAATQRLETERTALAIDPANSISSLRGLLKNHPLQEVLATYSADPATLRAAVDKVAPLLMDSAPSAAAMRTIETWNSLGSRPVSSLISAGRQQPDEIVSDQIPEAGAPAEVIQPLLKFYAEVSPKNPTAIALRLRYDLDLPPQLVAEWEATSTNTRVVRSLAEYYSLRQYLHGNDANDAAAAERCWKKVLEIDPSYANFVTFAEYYKGLGNMASYRSTILKALETNRPGLDNARGAQMVAESYMRENDWKSAKPYALQAAQSGSAWGLSCASQCLEQLGEFPESEDLLEAAATRYEGAWLDWYLWCRRTGKGNLRGARSLCESVIAQLPPTATRVSFQAAVFCEMEGRPTDALRHLYQLVAAEPDNQSARLEIAILLHKAGMPADRDNVLRDLTNITILNKGTKPVLADAFRRMAGSSGRRPDPKELDFIQQLDPSPEVPTEMALALGRILLALGRENEAVPWLALATGSPHFSSTPASRAAAELRALKKPIPKTRTSELSPEVDAVLPRLRWAIKGYNSTESATFQRIFDDLVLALPNSPMVAYWAAFCANPKAVDPVRSERLYSEVLRMVPDQPWVLCCRGRAREQKQDLRAALADYQEALKVSPNYLIALNNLGWVFAASAEDAVRDPAQALKYAQAVQATINDVNSFFDPLLAAAQAENGNIPQATQILEAAISKPTFRNKGAAQLMLKEFQAGRPYHRTVDSQTRLDLLTTY